MHAITTAVRPSRRLKRAGDKYVYRRSSGRRDGGYIVHGTTEHRQTRRLAPVLCLERTLPLRPPNGGKQSRHSSDRPSRTSICRASFEERGQHATTIIITRYRITAALYSTARVWYSWLGELSKAGLSASPCCQFSCQNAA